MLSLWRLLFWAFLMVSPPNVGADSKTASGCTLFSSKSFFLIVYEPAKWGETSILSAIVARLNWLRIGDWKSRGAKLATGLNGVGVQLCVNLSAVDTGAAPYG